MIKILHCHWLNNDKYNLGKLTLTMLWVLVTIYVKEYKAFVPSYNLPKIKNKTLIYISKNLSSEVRLQNEKVLDTHSAQTESGLLDSNDQYTLFAWCLWYVEHTWQTLTEINSSKFILWMYPLF